MKITVFNESDRNLEMSLTILIPKKEWGGSDFDIDKCNQNNIGYMTDMLGMYSDKLITVLQNRMQACQQNLINHLNDVEFNDGQHIVYRRKDNTLGSFNVPSFKAMQDCVKALENSAYKSVLQNKLWIDQILKALLNDPDNKPVDRDEFKYSNLVSMLCELQACPAEYLPK